MGGVWVFYEVEQVPVHSVLLLATREEAIQYPKADIALAFCEHCGFVFNAAFDPSLHEYSSRYEETQGFSPTFQAFHKALANRLVEQYDLRNKHLIEIGCGKGEFLTMLCELGGNRGTGFDPAYIDERNTSEAKSRMTFIKDLYSEKYSSYHGDFVCCKMTLEHISDTAQFMGTVRRSVGDNAGTIVFFQIPELRRILRERAFWDIYYEHCSYFTKGSLARLFRRSGFDVIDLDTEYDDQYLTIEARPGSRTGSPPLADEEKPEELKKEVRDFKDHMEATLLHWRNQLEQFKKDNKRVVIWGGGSKGVAFLTKLNIRNQIQYAVDVNPYKHGYFMAGTGQEIVSPAFLQEYRPDIVIVMNPIYQKEIQADLDKLHVPARILPIA